MIFKAIAVSVILVAVTVPAAMGQLSRAMGDEPLSVEMMIIRENSISAVRQQNLFALVYTANAIDRGVSDPEVYAALERLVLGGSFNRVVAGGRVVNNFPDVRFEAARQLGMMGTEEARDILLRACLSERDPIVLHEVMNSLGSISAAENDRTVATIVWVAGMFHRANSPNNHVALATVNALDSIFQRDGGVTYPAAFWYLFAVAEGPYVLDVRTRAWEVIDNLRDF